MPTRRTFLINSFASLGTLALSPAALASAQPTQFRGKEKFKEIVSQARKDNWKALPIGELMGKIAKQFEGTPYVAHTLDGLVDKEMCTVDLTGLDCVTFFETTLGFARMLKKGGGTPEDLLSEVTYTRYRGGKPGDYGSRLHYTTDWLVDNENKGVVKILSQMPGAEPFKSKVGFMSSHPDSYRQLAAHPDLVTKLKQQEEIINGRSLMYYPLDKIAAVEHLLQTGDIVGACAAQPGIDIAHTGLIYKDQDGTAHFMDASSKKSNMKVTIEGGPIGKTFSGRSGAYIGAMFARPLEPTNAS